MTTTASQQASDRVKTVDEAFVNARGAWSGVGISLGSIVGITPKSQVLTAIRQMQTLGRDPWAARRTKLAENDAQGWARWVQDGNDLLKNLANIAQDASTASLPAIVVATVAETKQTVQSAAATIWDAKYIIAAIVVGIAIITWRIRA